MRVLCVLALSAAQTPDPTQDAECTALCSSMNAKQGKFEGMTAFLCEIKGKDCDVTILGEHPDCSEIAPLLPAGYPIKETERSRQNFGVQITCELPLELHPQGAATGGSCNDLCAALNAKAGKFEGMTAFTCDFKDTDFQHYMCDVNMVGEHPDCSEVRALVPMGCPVTETERSRQNFGIQITCELDLDATACQAHAMLV